MDVIINIKAFEVLDNIAAFVESKNTPGSGGRYVMKFVAAIEKLAKPNVQYALCSHPVLAQLRYSCRDFNGWVIVFRINGNVLTVSDIIHGSLLF